LGEEGGDRLSEGKTLKGREGRWVERWEKRGEEERKRTE
jgi:hypothetical protein